MLKPVNLRNYMMTNPLTVKQDDNLLDAVRTIINSQVSGVCVIDEKENLVGVLSELDCLQAILSATYNESTVGKVYDYMSKDNLDVSQLSDNIFDVTQEMLSKKQRRRPIIENGKLVGQITCRQLLKTVVEFN